MNKEKNLSAPEILHKAAAFCSKSEHCITEVKEKLKSWHTDPLDSEAIIEHLIKEKFIDETRYCRSFINDKYKYNRWGRIKIAYALRTKKIADTLIHEAMDEVIDEGIYLENLHNLLKEKRKSVKGNNKQEINGKLFRFAAGRGFESNEISAAINKE